MPAIVLVFLKVNKLFKRLTITVDAQNVSHLLFSKCIKIMGPTMHAAVMAHHTPIF
jgi:hypothetical protein